MKKIIISESQSNVLDLIAKQKEEKDALFSKHTDKDKKDNSFLEQYRKLANKHDEQIEDLKETIKTEKEKKLKV